MFVTPQEYDVDEWVVKTYLLSRLPASRWWRKGREECFRGAHDRTISLVLETRFGNHPPTKMHSLDSIIIIALKGGESRSRTEEGREDREDWIKAKHAVRSPLFEAPYLYDVRT